VAGLHTRAFLHCCHPERSEGPAFSFFCRGVSRDRRSPIGSFRRDVIPTVASTPFGDAQWRDLSDYSSGFQPVPRERNELRDVVAVSRPALFSATVIPSNSEGPWRERPAPTDTCTHRASPLVSSRSPARDLLFSSHPPPRRRRRRLAPQPGQRLPNPRQRPPPPSHAPRPKPSRQSLMICLPTQRKSNGQLTPGPTPSP
jgi:hypothetical protein